MGHGEMTEVGDSLRDAWNTYYRTLDECRAMIENTARFKNNPEERNQAYYCLLEVQAMAYNFAMAPRQDYPRINIQTSWNTYFYTMGGNGTDILYGTLFLNGSRTYRLKGRWGKTKVLVVQHYSHLLGHSDANDSHTTNYDFANFTRGDDGSFEVILGGPERENNWIPLEPESKFNFLWIRRIFGDWNDDLGELDVEALDAPEPHDEQGVAERMLMASGFMKRVVQDWMIGLYEKRAFPERGKNIYHLTKGQEVIGGSPSTSYGFLIWEIEGDEALILETEVPISDYWSFQTFDVWLKSLDFMNFQTDVNMQRAVLDTDGKLRAVLSLKDPGVPNWLDPRGHRQGVLAGRNYRATKTPEPTIRKVKLDELRLHLPADTPVVTPKEREEALVYRRRSVKSLACRY